MVVVGGNVVEVSDGAPVVGDGVPVDDVVEVGDGIPVVACVLGG